MNETEKKLESMDWTLRLSDTGGVKFGKKNPLRFAKEAIYVSRHFDGKREFDVTEEDVDHWVRSGKERLAAGIKIPLPVGHSNDPEANRGWVDKFEKRVDEKTGRISLYVGGTVRDEEAKATLKANDVSIAVPTEHRTVGRTWKRPIAHVAITSTPRVKGLKEFELTLSEPIIMMEGESSKLDTDETPDLGDEKTFADYLRNLRRSGMRSREILKSLERLNNPALLEAIKQIEIPDNRFRGDDYEQIDSTAFALAEEHGAAYLVRDGDDVLVLSEEHEDAFRKVTA